MNKFTDVAIDSFCCIIDNMGVILSFCFLLTVFTLVGGCIYKGYDDIDYIKERAEQRWEEQGFEVVGYDGYSMGTGYVFTDYGSAHVWYRLKRVPDNGIMYSGSLKRWGDELHVYNIEAVDAIKPN